MGYHSSVIYSIEQDIKKLEDKYSLSFDEILKILDRKKEMLLPLSIFKNEKLSVLEAIVKYLKESLNLDYKRVASLLNRNYDSIAITYRNSRKKMKDKLDESSDKKIPLEIFRDKKLSILENLTSYLKENMNYTYHEIAVLLNRDDRTIWTCYNRAMKKKK